MDSRYQANRYESSYHPANHEMQVSRTISPPYQDMPEGRSVIVNQTFLKADRYDEIRQWLEDMKFKVKDELTVVREGKLERCFIFKKRNEAFHFKMVWG